MVFRTKITIDRPSFQIEPMEQVLLVGSCFADNIGKRFVDDKFKAIVNPFGVMYNPASVLHTIERIEDAPRVVFLTLGTNHVYRLKETGEIVDNCEKRPQSLFQEEELTVEACVDYLCKSINILRKRRPDVHVVLTVSPIRYQKYGFHGSQLSKATLLLAVDKVTRTHSIPTSPSIPSTTSYFPAYEIVNDELRDYRFYASDMLHPSEQTVDYIWERLSETYFSEATKKFLQEWYPIKQALNHKPFHPYSEEYKAFMDKTMLKVDELKKKYPTFAL
ncbi:MAG: GSCFA domain-containing protein [Prevotella sp.]|nr:GSCFA domain-containing protein [Prevotella sp.]MBQ8152968.1 GSCFA domain-containing protein [Prevotella sp.]